MIKTLILSQMATALQQAASELNQLTVDDTLLGNLKLERPRNPEHGDYAVNVSFLAKHTKMAPPKIAEIISRHWANDQLKVTVIGGYINFALAETLLNETLVSLIHNPKPGLNGSQAEQKVLLEYVSANPTGPLHIGHGRWAALGDSIVRILRHNGAFVTPEFYINDAGVQMQNIASSVFNRCIELLRDEGLLPAWKDETLEFPYPGDYVVEIARQILAIDGWRQQFLSECNAPGPHTSERPKDDVLSGVSIFAEELLLKEQKKLLEKMRVNFEGNFISEKKYLYDRNLIPETLKKLDENDYTYEADDALWFKSTEFGDEKDRVLRKTDGSYTYLTPDIAYHDDKYCRPQHYNRILNIWGADHHGYIARMRGAIQALGHDPNQFEVLLGQLVNLVIDGTRTRMGKRRKMLTLQDVVDEVGVDATRFWMVSKSADTTLDFDVDLAASASSENPVFYVQYAYARCCSILRNAVEASPNVDTGTMNEPYIQADALTQFEKTLSISALAPLFDALPDEKEKAVLKALILHLDGFEDVVKDAARIRAPHFIAQYTLDLSANFHSFYNVCRILTPEPSVTQARLMLIRAIQKTLAQALELLGVSAPEKM